MSKGWDDRKISVAFLGKNLFSTITIINRDNLSGVPHGPYGGYGVIIIGLCQSSVCMFGNHFELSFELDDRPTDP